MADPKKNPWGKNFKSIRNLKTTLGVVEYINTIRGPHNASYAWITTEKGKEISIKLTTAQDLVAGQLVALTQTFSSKAYCLHSTEVEHQAPIPILGTAKYVNRTRRGWAVAITTRSQRRMRKPLLKYRMPNRPEFSQGQLVSFPAGFDKSGPMEIKEEPQLSNGSPSEKQLVTGSTGIILPNSLCEWLANLGVNAIHQAGLHGNFPYVLEGQHSLSLLEREEKTIRDCGLLESKTLQVQLEDGLNEVRYIRPRDNASIRRLRDDLLQVDRAGLRRKITVLVPVHDLTDSRSFHATCQSLLLKPGFVHLNQIHLLDSQRLTFSSKNGQSTALQRLAVISVSSDTNDSRIHPAVQTDDLAPKAFSASQKLWLKKHSTQAVKFLLRKEKAKKIMDRLRPVARVTREAHEMDRHFVPIVATFDTEYEATKLTNRVATSEDPVFMAPAFDYYYGDLGVFNVTTVAETPASFLYTIFDAKWVYPVSRTRYRIGTSLTWTKLVTVVLDCSDRVTKLSSDGGMCFEPAGSETESESEMDEKDADGMVLKLSGFPSCVSRRALIEAVRLLDENASLDAAHFSPDGQALLVTVSEGSKLAESAENGTNLETTFGAIAVQVARDASRTRSCTQDAKTRQESLESLLGLFGSYEEPITEEKRNKEKNDESMNRKDKESECGTGKLAEQKKSESEREKRRKETKPEISDNVINDREAEKVSNIEKHREELPHTLENPDSGHQNPKRASNTLVVSHEDGQAGIMPSSPNCHTDSGPLGSQPTSDSDSEGQTGQLVPGTQTTQLESPTQHDKRALHRVVSMMLTPSQMHLHEKITNTLIGLPALERKNLLDNPDLMAKLPELVNAHTAEVGSISEREKSTTNTPITVESASAEAGNMHGPPHSASEEQSERQAQVSLSPTLTTSRQSWAEIGESADEIGSDTEENKSEISCDDEKTTTDEDSDSETSSPVRKKLRQRQNQRGDRASGTNSNE